VIGNGAHGGASLRTRRRDARRSAARGNVALAVLARAIVPRRMLGAEEIRDVNVRYHDLAADEYDRKWAIDYGPNGRSQVEGKLARALGVARPQPFGRALEVGAGTGYFILNLLEGGLVREAVATDISPGMLAALRASAERLGLEVETVQTDAGRLPFPDASFDLVFGHAVLHHLPDLDAAFREFHRVLRPGGTIVFCGEPSRTGDRVAALPKRVAARVAPLWRRLLGARPRADLVPVDGHDLPESEEHRLEWVVDVHAFEPARLRAAGRAAGFEAVKVRGEELAASTFGWVNRTLESTADPADVPWAWSQYAYRGYLMLQRLDRALLEPHLPPALFYNLLLSARRPGSGQ
jgi:SAM-dependent methyltransferase